MGIRFLLVIVFAAAGLAFSATTGGAQTKTAKVRIKFSGTGTCMYIDSAGHVRLKPGQTLPTCDPNDNTLLFERAALAGSKSSFRHLATNLCLKIIDTGNGQTAVTGLPCTAQDRGFALVSVASGGRVQFQQSLYPPPGLCCVRTYCLSVTGAGGSQNLAVLAELCANTVPMRFTLEPVF